MIKIAIVSLGKNLYSAFSLNQEYPLATVYKGTWRDDKDRVEQIVIQRFHSQRNEYKKTGASIPPINRAGRHRDGWKFIWKNIASIFEKPEVPQKQFIEEVLTKEPGLTITKKTPLASMMENALVEKEKMVIAEVKDGRFSFTPVTEDIIGVSEIPDYITKHSTEA